MATVIEIVAFTVGVGAAINFFFYALPRNDKAHIIIACAAIVVFTTIGIAAHLIARLPIQEPVSNGVDADRAWVTVKEVTFSNHLQIGQTPSVEIVLINSGRSPALDLTIIKSIRIDAGLPDGEMPREASGVVSQAVLGAGIELVGSSALNRPRTDLEVAFFKQGKSHLYTYGLVRYRIVSDKPNAPLHETQFCGEAIRTSATGEASWCNKWNHAT